jgi:hypothetical protein
MDDPSLASGIAVPSSSVTRFGRDLSGSGIILLPLVLASSFLVDGSGLLLFDMVNGSRC